MRGRRTTGGGRHGASAAAHRPWFVLLLLLALPAVGRAQPAVPPLTGRVVDRADILSPATEQHLTALLEAHEQATTNQVAVLTIPSL